MLHLAFPWGILCLISFGTVAVNVAVFYLTLYLFAILTIRSCVDDDPKVAKEKHDEALSKVKPIALGWLVYCFVVAIVIFVLFNLDLAIVIFISSVIITFVSAILITILYFRRKKS